MDDAELRHEIYRALAETGRAPRRADVDGAALDRLAAAHAVVLDDAGEIRMALPFSAIPTSHRVVAGERSWWANCAWDALAIPVALGTDAAIEATWMDTGEHVGLSVTEGELSSTDGFIHFALPARRWWDDIVET